MNTEQRPDPCPCGEDTAASSTVAPEAYEPPTLTRVGDLRDLLGGKSGTIPDGGNPTARHP